MNDKLYNLMNWPEIEAIVYAECEDPGKILGEHITDKGLLIQVYMPFAKKVVLIKDEDSTSYTMEMVDENGFFAILLRGKKKIKYTLSITHQDGTIEEIVDPYMFESQITVKDVKRFIEGTEPEAYKILGAHETAVDGIKGVQFAVWAPDAVRVSTVGDFNNWDGRVHPMRPVGDSGIYELFIPKAKNGDLYKYEIRAKGGKILLKSDPYAYSSELRPNNASKVWNISDYKWKDRTWMATRKDVDSRCSSLNIYEMHIGYFRCDDNGNFKNYREIAKDVCEYVKNMGYTHIELMPVMEHTLDESLGYQTTAYYAPTARYGTPQDFMYFVDYMHSNGIGVILDMVMAYFPDNDFGLTYFDGKPLYEYPDPKMSSYPSLNVKIFNYALAPVRNYLISSAYFWIDRYHADGIRINSVSSMLYLDYNKGPGEWTANMYGGTENNDAVFMLKELNNIIHKKQSGVIVIAEEHAAWPKVTGDDADSLGFDYKWNSGFVSDFLSYMSCDPLFRKKRYNELMNGMLYAYSENYILAISHDDVMNRRGTLLAKMPGDIKHKFTNVKLMYGYMYTHPGKKHIFMGQDMAEMAEWSGKRSIHWELTEYDITRQMMRYISDISKIYTDEPALYINDSEPDSFEWINNFSANDSIISFARKSKEDELVIIANFDDVVHYDYMTGVPHPGKYKEIFNSDAVEYGGDGVVNPRKKTAKEEKCDGRDYSLKVNLPALGIIILRYEEMKEK